MYDEYYCHIHAVDIFKMLNSEQAVEAAGRAEEIVCCLVKMTQWGCYDGIH